MILVTGGTGLVGSHLLLELVRLGRKPRAIYRHKDRIEVTKKVFSYYVDDHELLFSSIEWVQCDILDVPKLETAFDEISEVYHAAALISFDPTDDKTLLKVNVGGTANVANLCIAHGVKKLCYVSSIAAIGPSVANEPIKESNDWTETTGNGYAFSKHLAEMEVWRASQEGVPVAIVNPGIILGAGHWYSGSGKFFYAASKSPKYYLPSGTGFVSVEDVVAAMLLIMDSEIENERFILVSENWTYKLLSEIIAKGLGKNPPKKEIKLCMLHVFWRFDWVRSKLSGKKRRLSKATAKVFEKREYYDNTKLKKSLPAFEYQNLKKKVGEYATAFLEERAS